jgi:dipeptidyl aminopeptidase/acylaminoacyl peptidase
MVTTKDIKAGVIWAGVVATYPDMITNWRRPASAPPLNIPERVRRWRQEFLDTYGTPEENPVFWASISPSEFVGDLSGPLQLHHGTADVEVPLAFTQDLYARVQQAGIPVEYYEYPADDHNLSKNLTTALNRSVAFFDKYVKGGE